MAVGELLLCLGRGSRLCNKIYLDLQPCPLKYSLALVQTQAESGHGYLTLLIPLTLKNK